jgi:hypothetical protein
MATTKQPKGILKKTSYPATSKTKAERDREIALYHANLIQQRKDIELEILLSTETLIDYPLASSPHNASNPSPSDAESFKHHIRLFQTSDYDALIEERNINEHCGYTLCPNPRLKEEGVGKYRLIYKTGRAKDFKVVEKTELEKWCSDACARRALYVRVQLSETAAWERGAAGSAVRIDLLDEPKAPEDAVMEGIEQLNLSDTANARQEKSTADLALERGDKGFAAKNGLVDVKIQEKEVSKPAEPPSFDEHDLTDRLDTLHLNLEGHTTTFGSDRQRRRNRQSGDGDVDTEDGMDWQL